MNKRAIFILGLFTLFFGSAYVTTKVATSSEENNSVNDIGISYREENISSNEETLSTSTEEIKTTPNTELILKKYYTDCGHEVMDKAELPAEMVNLTETELIDKYPSWKIEEFSKEEVILSKELDSFCGEHYLLLEEEGEVSIYILDKDGNRVQKEETEIAFDYLPETDKTILRNGMYIYGTEELNKIREDFES